MVDLKNLLVLQLEQVGRGINRWWCWPLDTTPADAAPIIQGDIGGELHRMAHSAVGQTEGSTGSGAAGGGQSIAIRKGAQMAMGIFVSHKNWGWEFLYRQ